MIYQYIFAKGMDMSAKRRALRGDITPMIDCVFLLLIFFIIAAKFVTPEGHMDAWMPKNSGPYAGTPKIAEDTRIIMRGGESKNIKLFLDSYAYGEFDFHLRKWKLNKELDKFNTEIKKIEQAFNGENGLAQRLKNLQQNAAVTKVVIDADPHVPYIFIVKAIEACKDAYVEDIQFTGAKKRLWKDKGKNSPIR